VLKDRSSSPDTILTAFDRLLEVFAPVIASTFDDNEDGFFFLQSLMQANIEAKILDVAVKSNTNYDNNEMSIFKT